MEEKVEKLFSNDLLHQAASQFNATDQKAKKLGDFENFVYEVHLQGEPIVLRLTHSSHRSFEEVEAELEWVKYLSDNGVQVAKPILSKNDRLVESFRISDSYFYVSCFTKASGSTIDISSSDFSESLFYTWGKTIGVMNRVTKSYQAKKITRQEWDEDDLINNEKYLGTEDKIICEITKELVEELHNLPKDKDSYGLIHGDIHSGNFFYDGKNITVFDFDDCSYHWYISDVAIPLFYTIWAKSSKIQESELIPFANHFFKAFWKGYCSENFLSDDWLDLIPLFLRLRDALLYTVFHKKLSKEDINGRYKELIQSIRERIINKRPIIKLDYQHMKENCKG